MATEKRSYTCDIKLEAIRLHETSGKSMSEVERELGITAYLLSKWVKQFQEEEQSAFPGKGDARDEEIRMLKREVEILKQEGEIIKKTVGIFSNPKRWDTGSFQL